MAEKKESVRKISERESVKQAKAVLEIATQKAMARDYEFEILELKNKNIELENELKNYKKTIMIGSIDDDDIMKKILSYHAKGYTYKLIYDKMRYCGFDGEIQDIETVCKNVEDLSNEMILYYKKEQSAYEDQIKINTDVLKDNLVYLFQELINSASLDLDGVTDIETKRKIRYEIKDHAKELSTLIKNIQEGDLEINQNDILSKIAKNLNGTLGNADSDLEEMYIPNIQVM